MSDTVSNEQQSVSNTDQQCFLYVSHPLQMWKTTRSNSKMYLGLKITSEARGYSSSSKTWPKMTQTYRCQSLICWCHWKLHHEIDNKKHMENSGQEWEGAAHIRGQNAIKSFVRHKLLITWKSKPQRGMSTLYYGDAKFDQLTLFTVRMTWQPGKQTVGDLFVCGVFKSQMY